MTLQSRLALDMLLLKEQGVCGMLNLSEAECCITIYNASPSIEEAQAKMKEIADQTGELLQSTQPHDWCDGLNPGSWITTILKIIGTYWMGEMVNPNWSGYLNWLGIFHDWHWPSEVCGKPLDELTFLLCLLYLNHHCGRRQHRFSPRQCQAMGWCKGL